MSQGIENGILKELEECQEGASPLLEFYRKLLTIQYKDKPRLSPSGLSEEEISARLKEGKPLLSFAELALDRAELQGRWAKVVSLFAEYSGLFSRTPDSFDRLASGLNMEVVRAWFEGSELPVADADRPLLEDMVRGLMSPVLAWHAEMLLPRVRQELWRRRFCPICGGEPDFAFLEKEAGARWLVCSRCNAEWLFQRLECPHCGSSDQNALSYYTDEKGRYRLYTCDKCKRYLKAIDLRQTEGCVLIPCERLKTLDIDAQAQGEGYNP